MELRPFQAKALRALESPGHVICTAPTGSGKSLIYESHCARQPSRTLLITPLIALARQQERRLREAGVPAAIGRPPGGSGVWIACPESAHPSRIGSWRPSFLVVDEAHCIQDWGDSFRPDFQKIPSLVSRLCLRKSLWLSATLTRAARDELKSTLPGPVIEIGTFGLPDRLRFRTAAVPWPHRLDFLRTWCLRHTEPGIIFVSTRRRAEALAMLVADLERPCVHYHAGLSVEERRLIEGKMESGEPLVVVATTAFGMGMDFPHLQWALLFEPPPSILQLAQMIGRVGRAGDTGLAVALWDDTDFVSSRPEGHGVRKVLTSPNPRSRLAEEFEGSAAPEPQMKSQSCTDHSARS